MAKMVEMAEKRGQDIWASVVDCLPDGVLDAVGDEPWKRASPSPGHMTSH